MFIRQQSIQVLYYNCIHISVSINRIHHQLKEKLFPYHLKIQKFKPKQKNTKKSSMTKLEVFRILMNHTNEFLQNVLQNRLIVMMILLINAVPFQNSNFFYLFGIKEKPYKNHFIIYSAIINCIFFQFLEIKCHNQYFAYKKMLSIFTLFYNQYTVDLLLSLFIFT